MTYKESGVFRASSFGSPFPSLLSIYRHTSSMSESSRQHIYLIGPRGCGKTTVGQLLAQRLEWTWVDLDQVIQEQAGQSITEIFARQGQSVFRDLESTALLDQAQRSPRVISLGGGAVLRRENQEAIQNSGFTVFLNADVETLVQRISSDPQSAGQRPALNGPIPSEVPDRDPESARKHLTDEVKQILALRMPVYQQTSDLQLDTTRRSPAEIVEQILRWLPHVNQRFAQLISESETS